MRKAEQRMNRPLGRCNAGARVSRVGGNDEPARKRKKSKETSFGTVGKRSGPFNERQVRFRIDDRFLETVPLLRDLERRYGTGRLHLGILVLPVAPFKCSYIVGIPRLLAKKLLDIPLSCRSSFFVRIDNIGWIK